MRQEKKAGRPITGVRLPTKKFHVVFENTSIVVDAVSSEHSIEVAQQTIMTTPHPDYCRVDLDKPISTTELVGQKC